MERTEVKRIAAEEASRRLQAGQAMLICAYEADEKFHSLHLEGAVSYHQFAERLPQIDADQEMIFYCA